MAHLIDKDALIAEIEKCYNECLKRAKEAIDKSFVYHDSYGDDFRSDKQIETAYRCGFEEGAKWGKNQAKVEIQAQSMALAHGCPKEPVSEDLEEAIQKTIHNHFFDLNGIAIAGTSVYATVDDMVYIAKHFANWQKEQMMKDAITTKIKGSRKFGFYFDETAVIQSIIAKNNFRVGDKCKMILIKED